MAPLRRRRVAFLWTVARALAQAPAVPSLWTSFVAASPDLAAETAHFELRTGAMGVLAGWAIANILLGGAGAALFRQKGIRIFLGACAAWNLVNLAIAGFGLYDAASHVPGTLSGTSLVREIVFFRGVIWVNLGLDVGYAMAGLVAWLWGRDRPCVWRQGIGLALVVQGLFLFGFDLTLALRFGAELDALWGSI